MTCFHRGSRRAGPCIKDLRGSSKFWCVSNDLSERLISSLNRLPEVITKHMWLSSVDWYQMVDAMVCAVMGLEDLSAWHVPDLALPQPGPSLHIKAARLTNMEPSRCHASQQSALVYRRLRRNAPVPLSPWLSAQDQQEGCCNGHLLPKTSHVSTGSHCSTMYNGRSSTVPAHRILRPTG